MRKFYQITVTTLLIFAGLKAAAQSGIYESYVIVNINGGGNTYYDMGATTGNPDFNGANLGTFSGANTLVLNGGENKTFKCAPCDITNGNLWYRIYPTGSASGSFNQIAYFFGSNLGSGCGGNDQSWNATSSNINLLSGLSPGNYTLEVYSTADYQGCGTGTNYSSNSGANYKATFTYCGSMSGALPAGNYYIPSTCFPTMAYAFTYLSNASNGVSGAVVFNVAAGYTETAPVNGLTLSTITGASATNTVTFRKSGTGTNPTITAFNPQTSGGRMDGVIRLVGADYVTIDGFTLQENSLNTTTTIASNNMTEFGVGIFGASASNGSQNNTIQNCTISLGNTYPSATGVFSTSTLSTANAAQVATSSAGLNSNNKFYTNTISNVNQGFIIICPTATSTLMESGIEIGGSTAGSGNTITYGLATGVGQSAGWTGIGTSINGIMLNTVAGISIRNNTLTNTITSNTATDHTAILFSGTVPSSGTYTRTISNNTITLNNSATTAISAGITLGNGISTGTIDVSSNTITINKTSGAANSAAITGITAGYAAAAITIAGNTINLNTSISAGSYTGAITGITVSATGTASTVVNINGSNAIKINQSVSGTGSYGSGLITYVNASYAATGAIVNVNNNSFNTTSSTIRSTGNVVGVNCEATVGLFNIKSNSFVVDRVAASGTVNFTAQTGTPSNVADTISGNTITLTNLAGTTAVTAISQLGGTGSSVKNICNNTISITGTNTGTINGITLGYGSGHRISGNSITVSTASPTIIGIVTGSNYGTTNANNIRLNSISLTSSASSGIELTGIKVSVGGNTNVFSNTISNLSFSAASTSSPSINGIWCSVGSNNVYQNSVSGLSFTGTTGGPTIRGIVVSGGTTHVIYKNKVYGLTASGTTGNVTMYGIGLTGGTTGTLYNNLISGLSMSTAQNSNGSPMSGIFASGTGTHNIYNNTVYISGTTSGSIFYSAGLYTSATATAVDVRNNIIVNECSPVGAGTKAAAHYRSGTSTTNLSANSNKNFYYAGTPSASNCIYFDITNTDQTISAYQSRVTPKEAGSFTESFSAATYFSSLVGSNAGFLHIPNGLSSQIESGATAISTPVNITDDYDGQTRPGGGGTTNGGGTAPDVGADEYDGSSPSPVITFNSLSPAGGQCSASAHTVSVDVTTPSGTISSVNITYNNGSSTGPVAMTNSSGSTYTYSIPAASPANASVTYSVVATNSIGISTTYTGTAYSDAPAFGVTATATATPSTVCSGSSTSLSVQIVKSGTVSIGAGGTTGTGAPYNPFNGGYGGMKANYLIRASELTAAGLTAGNITAIALDFSGVGTTYNGFGISMGHTALTALTSSTIQSGLTSVYSAASVTPTVGINTYTLSTPFNWDGSSNVIIATCWSNNNASNTSATIKYDATAYQSSVSYRKDNETSSNMCSFTGSTGSGTNTFNNGSNRPKFVITGNAAPTATAFSWSDGSTVVGTTNPLSQSPTTGTTYTCTATVSGCSIVSSGAAVTINPPTTSPTNTSTATQCGTTAVFSISTAVSSPTIKWYAASSGGSAISGATSTTFTVTGLSAGLNSRWATVTDASGCESARVQCDVTLTSADALTAAVNPTGNICLGNSISLSVTQSGSNGNVYALTWQAAGAGSGLTSNTAGSLSPATLSVTPTATGTYTYTINGTESGTGCAATSSVNVTVIDPFASATATATNSPTSFCPGSSTSLNVTVGNSTLPTGYCTITAGTSSSSYFNSFSTTGGSTNITNSGSNYSTNGYGDFTSLKVEANRNSTINFSTSLVGTTVGVALWVDWNQNGTFETSERMYQTGSYVSSASGSFTVPATANFGLTRMRILMDYNTGAPTNPCGPFAFGRGEVEDYTFQVTPTGLTYSWSDGSTNVGTTNPLSVTPPTGTTNYTCTVSSGGCSVTSNSLAVTPSNSSLGGTYTVGTAGTYPTITAAVAAWTNTCAISAPVVFSLLDATYPSETFPITLNEQPLAGPTKTLTIRPASGVTTTISGSNANALFVLNGADYITFDGSNNGSTSTDMTITNTNTGTSSLIFKVNSVVASTSGATNNTLKNMVLTGSGRNNTFACIYQGGATVPSAADYANNNNTYSNNVITASQDGIIVTGVAAGTETGLTISNNTLGHATTNASRHAYDGIFVSNESNFAITGNTVLGVQSNYSGNIEGILVGGASTNGTVDKNIVSYVNNNSTSGYPASGITLNSSVTGANITVTNNILSGMVAYGYSGVYWNGHGLLVNKGTGYNIYHNTIALSTNQTIAATTAGIFINGTSSTVTPVPASLDIRNNIFTNTETTGTPYAIYSEVANTAFTSINNNVYYSAGTNLGYLGSGQTTLAAWQTATGQDASSLNVAPVFISTTNFHLNASANPTLDGAGATGTGVTSDIDGDVRCPGASCPGAATNPDPGADEFEVPVCLSPSALTASSITSVGVSLSWTAPSTAPSVGYEWLIVATGAGSGGTPITTTPAAGGVTGTSVSGITGLTANTTYDAYVRSDCGSGLYSSYLGPITFTTRPANDECAGAISVTVNSSNSCTSTTTGTSVNASQSLVACAGAGTADDDVWYSFVALGTAHTITVTPGTMNNANFEVFSGSCGSLVSLSCMNNTTGSSAETSGLTGLTIGATYYVRVFSNGNGGGQGTFTLCISSPPANDACANAVNLPCGTTNLAGSTVGSIAETAPSGCASSYGVWYSLVGDGSPATVVVGASTMDHEITVVSGTCASLTAVTCVDNSSGATETATFNTTNGTTYYIYVANFSTISTTTSAFTVSRTSSFTLSNTGAPAASNIPVNTTDAVISGFQLAPTCVTFDATAVTFTTSGTATTADISNFRVYRDVNNNGTFESGTDVLASSSALALSTSLAFTITGQTGISSNARYLLVADIASGATIGRTITASVTAAGNVTTSSSPSTTLTGTATGNTQTISATPPANDLCSNATALPCGTNALAGTTVNCLSESAPFGCASNYGVWYTFTGDGTATTVSVAPTGFDVEITVGSGSCGSLTQISCTDANGSGTAESTTINTVNGTTYYVYIAQYSPSSTTTGAFTITRSASLALSNTGAPAAGNIGQGVSNVLISGFALSPACANYSLTGVTFTTSGTATTSDLSNFRVYRDANSNGIYDAGTDVLASSSALSLSASMAFTITGQSSISAVGRYLLVADVAAGATVGRTITASITAVANITYTTSPSVTATGTATGNTRTISAAPPANDECSSATAFSTIPTSGACVTLSNQTTANATASGVTPSGSCTSNSGTPDDDVWYSFVAPGPTVIVNFTYVSGVTDIYWQAFSSACGSTMTSIACSDVNSGGTLTGLTTGNTYYIRLYTYASSSTSVQDICLQTPPPPPSNDNCGTATAFPTIPTSGACVTLSNQTTAGATASGVTPTGTCTSNSGNPDDDVWYSFVAPGSTVIVNFTYVSGVTDIYWQAFSSACGASMTSIACSDANAGGTLTGLTTGNTYYIRLYTYAASATSVQNICLQTPPPPPSNDNCAGAIAFPTIPTDGSCSSLTAQSTAGATASGVTPTGSCTSNSGSPDDDVWYSFVATSTDLVVNFTYVSGATDIYWQVFSGSCGSTMTSILCTDYNDFNYLTGLTIGQTYYLRLYTYSSSVNTVQDICINAVPTNDDCADATPLTSCAAPTSGSILGSTESTVAPCGSSDYAYDLWYSYVAEATTATFKATGSSGFDAVLEVYSSCGGTNLYCRDNTGDGATETINATGLTPGATYYIRVYAYDDYYFTYPTTYSFTVQVGKPGYWTGAVSTDWNTAGNWCDNTVPTTTTDVTIPNQANDPIVGSYTANCANFTIQSGATFGFSGGVANSVLVINGSAPVITTAGNTFSGAGVLQIGAGSAIATITGGATFNNDRVTVSSNSFLKLNGSSDFNIGRTIRVNSGATVLSFGSNNTGNYPSTSNATAYLHFTDNGTNNGIVDYNGGSANGFILGQVISDRKINASNSGYRYISSPVQGSISQWADDFTITGADGFVNTGTAFTNPWPTMWQYDETNTNTNMVYGWLSYTNTSNTLDRAKGFAAITPGSITIDLTGPLNVPSGIAAGTISKAVTSTSSGQPLSDGWNLLGNPYQAPLGFANLRTANSSALAAYAYYWVSNGTYSGTYASFNALTNLGTNGGTAAIAPHQGFMVRANSNTNISMNNSMTTNSSAYGFLKGEGPAADMPIFRLSLKENGKISDEVVVASHPNATVNKGSDDYDTDKMFNFEQKLSEIYLTESEDAAKKLAVSVLPAINNETVVPVGISHEGVYNVQVSEMVNIPSGVNVYLEDKKLNQYTRLNLGDVVSMTKTETESPEGRYFLRFGDINEAITAEEAQVIGFTYVENGNIQIKLMDAGINPSSARVMDISGKLIGNFQLETNNGVNSISSSVLAPGIYLVDVSTDKGNFVNKVVIPVR